MKLDAQVHIITIFYQQNKTEQTNKQTNIRNTLLSLRSIHEERSQQRWRKAASESHVRFEEGLRRRADMTYDKKEAATRQIQPCIKHANLFPSAFSYSLPSVYNLCVHQSM